MGQDYNYAVAGHAGTLCDADGELFIKPCTKSEISFYEIANAEHEEFAEILPLYFGSLQLTENQDVESIHRQIPKIVEEAHVPEAIKQEVQSHLHPRSHLAVPGPAEKAAVDNITWIPNKSRKITTDRACVLENSSYGYTRPNIMDVKLGTRLWADDAPLEKRERFDKIVAETTHKDLGFRIAGMRVFKGAEDKAELDEEEYKLYDKDWGRFSVTTETIMDAFRKFIFSEAAGIEEEQAKVVAGAFATDLRRVQQALEREETRMFSTSLLFVFEGDGAALKAAIEETSASAIASENNDATPGRAGIRVDSGIGMEEEDFEDDEDSDDEESRLPRIYSLKLIDFAHATFVPGQGPDENILKGVRSLVRLFEELSH